jgi:hypothetical protein
METVNVILPSTPERRVRRRECLTSLIQTAGIPINLVIYESEGEGWVKAVHQALEGLTGLSIIIGDDMTFEPNWLRILAFAYLKQFPNRDGLAQPYDEIHHGDLAVCPFATAEILREGIFEGYKHNFSDTELTKRMKDKGKYVYVPEAIVHHNHFLLGKSDIDETYKQNQKWYEVDKALFIERNK